MTRILVVLAAAMGVACSADAATSGRTYLPAVPRETALVGQSIGFDGVPASGPGAPVPLRLDVTAAERRAELPASTGCAVGYPGPSGAVAARGVFVVVLGQVTNEALVSGFVELSRFRMADSVGRNFDPADGLAQCTAQALYGRGGGGVLQPGFTIPVVLVFDVLPASTGLHLVLFSPTQASTETPNPAPTGTPTPLASTTLRLVSASASSEQPPANPAPAAIDGNPATFWRPAGNTAGPYLQVNLDGAQTVSGVSFVTAMGDAIATRTATVGPSTPTPTPFGASYRVSLVRPSLSAASTTEAPRALGGALRSALGLGTPTSVPSRSAQDSDCFSQFISADVQTVQASCGPYSGVTAIRIYLEAIGNPALPPGIREVAVYPPAAADTPTATPTSTATQGAGAATATQAAVETAAAATLTASVPTRTPTVTPTPTMTLTPTITPTP